MFFFYRVVCKVSSHNVFILIKFFCQSSRKWHAQSYELKHLINMLIVFVLIMKTPEHRHFLSVFTTNFEQNQCM